MGGMVRRVGEPSVPRRYRTSSIGRVRRLAYPAVILLLLVACEGSGGKTPSSPPASRSGPDTPGALDDPGVTGSAEPSQSVAVLPDGVPATYELDISARDLPIDRLIPRGDEISGVDRARTRTGEAIVIAFATPSRDPFVQARGFVVWLRSEGVEPPWRAVYGLTHGKRAGVLAISADATDLTGDGSDDALVREDTGGTGACATYRVIDLSAGAGLWTRSLCDAEVQPNPDPLGLYVVARVYEPGDPHCCPSAISERVLVWRDDRFVEISRVETPI
jgi:hypothetical protein